MKLKKAKWVLDQDSFREVTLEEFILNAAAMAKHQKPDDNFGKIVREIIEGINDNFEIDCKVSLRR